MTSTPDPQLMKILGFTVQDLEMNRTGLISEQQMERLRRELLLEVRRYALLFGIAWIASLIFVWSLYNSPLRQGQFQNLINGGVIIGIIALLAILIIYVIFRLQVRGDLTQHRVNFIDDKIEFRQLQAGRTLVEGIRISRKEFANIETDIFLSLKRHCQQDAIYRLYYTPYRRKILAIEVIE